MTKADLYKRRSKNKQRDSDTEPSTSTHHDKPEYDSQESLAETIANLKNRMHNSSIENDVELIRANTQDTPVNEDPEPTFTDNEVDEIPAVKPVERTYAKSRSKLDEYVYIESSKGLDDIEVSLAGKKEDASPVPKKRRKIETRNKVKEIVRELRSKDKAKGKKPVKKAAEKRPQKKEPLAVEAKKTRAKKTTKESIENDKTSPVTRVTRKRKHEEISKPVLREKGQNGHSSRKNSLNDAANETGSRKMAKPKKTKSKSTLQPLKLDVESNVRMTRSRQRRLEISLSPSQVKNFVPAFSFESDRRMTSVESNKSGKSQQKPKKGKTAAKPKPAKKQTSKVKKAPVRATRNRANRR